MDEIPSGGSVSPSESKRYLARRHRPMHIKS